MTAVLLAGWSLTIAVAWLALVRARRIGRLAAQASHEVRGPLCAAQLALDGLALRGELDAGRTVSLDAQLRRARLALDDLLLGPVAHRPEPVTLPALLAELEATWRPVALAQGRPLVVEPAQPGAVIADRTRLAQAVGNLVANALEHGRGPVALSAASGAGVARLTVTDHGAGPAATQAAGGGSASRGDGAQRQAARIIAAVERVRDTSRAARATAAAMAGGRFRNAGRGRGRGHRLTGLRPRGHGLSIAAAIAERAGGRLTMTGAACSIVLPLADPALLPAARRDAELVA